VLTFDPDALDALVLHATGHRPTTVEPMPGGASTRRYLRVRTLETSFVAMFVPDGAPDEITSGAPSARWPFLEVQALLHGHGVRVPGVLAEACAAGLLLIEDLGDETLAAFLGRAPARRTDIYRTAVTDLARAQRSLRTLPAGSVVAGRAFDETLLRWELDHFREWALDARGRALPPAERSRFDALADRLARRIAAWPRGFVHRDYQSRNLMVRDRGPGEGPELVWIDFQDALLGPRVYDLVALLNDSYQSFDRAFIEARLDEFAAEAGLDPADRAELEREFDVVTVQRKLKDAGRFVFIDRVKKNPSFLPYFEPSLAKVRASLARLADEEDMRALAEIVARA
jgi:aminoglycoside/choline kinase family phosphotransferase